jgi:hypothetical protein
MTLGRPPFVRGEVDRTSDQALFECVGASGQCTTQDYDSVSVVLYEDPVFPQRFYRENIGYAVASHQ